MNIVINVSATDIATEILRNSDKIGSSDWDIFTDIEGNIDCRHYQDSSDGWMEIIDLYSFWNDSDTLNSTAEELADWIQSDGLPDFPAAEWLNHETGDFEMIEICYG